ncbi:MAG: hypothetical protein GEU91_10380 [Rhizobiales bacterium]|nr:hypothetical protein [Hyphomicrobiales bacterium]
MTRRSWLSTFGAVAALLAALAGFATAQQPPKPTPGDGPELPSIEDLSATIERPLFIRSRRPPAAAPELVQTDTVTVPSEEAPADLTGIVNGPDKTYAILTSRATKETHHLQTGETIENWNIQEIGPHHIVLRRGTGSLRLELFQEKEAGADADGVDDEPGNRVRRPQNTRPRFVPQAQQIRRQPRRTRPTRPPRRPARDE